VTDDLLLFAVVFIEWQGVVLLALAVILFAALTWLGTRPRRP